MHLRACIAARRSWTWQSVLMASEMSCWSLQPRQSPLLQNRLASNQHVMLLSSPCSAIQPRCRLRKVSVLIHMHAEGTHRLSIMHQEYSYISALKSTMTLAHLHEQPGRQRFNQLD